MLTWPKISFSLRWSFPAGLPLLLMEGCYGLAPYLTFQTVHCPGITWAPLICMDQHLTLIRTSHTGGNPWLMSAKRCTWDESHKGYWGATCSPWMKLMVEEGCHLTWLSQESFGNLFEKNVLPSHKICQFHSFYFGKQPWKRKSSAHKLGVGLSSELVQHRMDGSQPSQPRLLANIGKRFSKKFSLKAKSGWIIDSALLFSCKEAFKTGKNS